MTAKQMCLWIDFTKGHPCGRLERSANFYNALSTTSKGSQVLFLSSLLLNQIPQTGNVLWGLLYI